MGMIIKEHKIVDLLGRESGNAGATAVRLVKLGSHTVRLGSPLLLVPACICVRGARFGRHPDHSSGWDSGSPPTHI